MRSALTMRMRAALEGLDAVTAAGVIYLPKPGGMDEVEYSHYLARATWFGATARTHESLVGLVMAKPALTEMPPALATLAERMNRSGLRLEDMARMAVAEVMAVGGGVALVDMPRRPDDIVTARQEQAAGLRPWASWYRLENVLDHRTADGVMTHLRLLEDYKAPGDDEWTVERKPQVRVHDIPEGRVRYRVFREASSGQWVVHEEGLLMDRAGRPLRAIPAVWFGPLIDAPGKPPLQDVADLNFAHYRNAADLEHALHFTGLPTPYASGVMPAEIEEGLTLGSSRGYAFSDAGAQIRFATYGADGLGALRDAMADKVQHMAALGARLLMTEGKQAESGEALSIRRSGEHSAIAKIADSVSHSMAAVLRIMADWAGIAGDISYSLNTDYLPPNISPQEIAALVGAWQQGALTTPELFDRFKQGGIVRDDMTYEEHEAAILLDEERPPAGLVTAPGRAGGLLG